MGDPWGISAPAFLLTYGVIILTVLVVGNRARRGIADEGPDRPPRDLAARPLDVAYLGGGAELTVYAALGSMQRAGTIAMAGPGRVRAAGRLAPGAGEIERAIHTATANPVQCHRLQFHLPVAAALRSIEDRLVSDGLLLSADQQRRIRAIGWWMVGVALFGLFRLLAGVANAQPDVLLAPVLVVVTTIGLAQLLHAPRRSRLGDATLAGLHGDYVALAELAAQGPAGPAAGEPEPSPGTARSAPDRRRAPARRGSGARRAVSVVRRG